VNEPVGRAPFDPSLCLLTHPSLEAWGIYVEVSSIGHSQSLVIQMSRTTNAAQDVLAVRIYEQVRFEAIPGGKSAF
jgi:hypothetical protein